MTVEGTFCPLLYQGRGKTLIAGGTCYPLLPCPLVWEGGGRSWEGEGCEDNMGGRSKGEGSIMAKRRIKEVGSISMEAGKARGEERGSMEEGKTNSKVERDNMEAKTFREGWKGSMEAGMD